MYIEIITNKFQVSQGSLKTFCSWDTEQHEKPMSILGNVDCTWTLSSLGELSQNGMGAFVCDL